MDRLEYIRTEEKKYHDFCYENFKLFESGSWLHKPVKTILDILEEFNEMQYISVLDLGCGSGRNSIPIAQTLKNRDGKVVCVDLLVSAITKLQEHSKEYEVQQFIKPIMLDIEHFQIEKAEYDFIIAVSALEHVSSEQILKKKLREMTVGTKPNGINCIIINSNVKEILTESNKEIAPMFEVNICTDSMFELLDQQYDGWNIQVRNVKHLEFDIDRNGQSIKLTTDN